MPEVFIVGHKNPDSDSICSAYAYAKLKNSVDSANRYKPVRCGNMNKQTRFIFDKFKIDAPAFVKDVYPKAGDLMTRKVVAIDENAPVADVIRNIDELKIRITPVVSDGAVYEGIISILELSKFFATGEMDKRPSYLFKASNFEKVIKGYTFSRGVSDEFDASVMIGAMPYERYRERMENIEGDSVLIVGKRRDIIEYAIEKRLPAIILTGMHDEQDVDIDFSEYDGWVYISEHDTAETLRRLMMSIPVKAFMNTDVPHIPEEEYIEKAKDVLLSIDHKGLPVLREGRLEGILTRSDLIKKDRRKLVLMDHNELTQAVDGAESAEIIEIVDHHRLGTIKTNTPIHFTAKPIGSTCSLVYEQYKIHGEELDKETAGILLSGILSDTVILKSPTTTELDKKFVSELEEITGLNHQEYGVEMFGATDSLASREPNDIICTDFKMYEEHGVKVGAGQVEVVTIEELEGVKPKLIEELNKVKSEKGVDWAVLLITDIIKEESILLTTDFEAGKKLLAYKTIDDSSYHLPGVLSRKKQLLPELLRVLEELNS